MSDLYYKPSQSDIYFVYDHIVKNVSIKSHVTILLPAGESLTVSKDYTDATKTAQKDFAHVQDPSKLIPYVYVDDSAVEFISQVEIPYDPQYQEAFKTALRNTFADEYTVKAIVPDKPDEPGSGGQNNEILAKTGSVIIL